MIEIEIDGKKIATEPGKMLIQVADEAGIYIPRFCYHKKLSIAANCRMCLVEVEKAPKTLPACATPVAEGMKVFTKSEKTKASQKAVMEFLLINHPLDCPICDQGGECELQDLSWKFGKDVSRYNQGKRSWKDENLGPLIGTFMTRCIQCTRCVRFGREIAGVEELGTLGRGENMRIGTEVLEIRQLDEKDIIGDLQHIVQSEVSGNVIDVCPVGALTSKPYLYKARAWELQQFPAIAPHDCLGSHVFVHMRGYEYSQYQGVMRVVPSECEEINETWISDQDRFSYLGLYSSDRVGKPLIKQQGTWKEVEWSIALNFVADQLRTLCQAGDADKIGAIISPSSTVEECIVMKELMTNLGSPHIDHRLQQIDVEEEKEISAPVLGITIAELENRDHILLIGSHLHREQPIAGVRIRKGVKRGGKVSVINPVQADFHFSLESHLVSADLIRELAGVAVALGIHADCLRGVEANSMHRKLAQDLLEKEKSSLVLGALALNHPHASVIKSLAKAIADKTGSSYGYLTAGANSTGAALAGCVPSEKGLSTDAMLQAPLKALFLLGVEPELDCAAGDQSLSTLNKAFVISLTSFAGETMREYADVILPIAAFAENEGTFVNIAGQVQRFKAATVPWDSARPAWKVVTVLASLLGFSNADYKNSEAIFAKLPKEQNGKTNLVKPLNALNTLPAYSEQLKIPYWPLYCGDMLVRRSEALREMVTLLNDKHLSIRGLI